MQKAEDFVVNTYDMVKIFENILFTINHVQKLIFIEESDVACLEETIVIDRANYAFWIFVISLEQKTLRTLFSRSYLTLTINGKFVFTQISPRSPIPKAVPSSSTTFT